MRKCKECHKEIKVYRKLMCNNCYRKTLLGTKCIDCQIPIYIVAKRCKPCADEEKKDKPKLMLRGKGNGRYTTGFRYKKGYREILVEGEGRYVLEHRVIVEQFLGRKLKEDEVIHHLNHNKLDNRIENLVIMTPSEHSRFHWDTNWKHRRIYAN